MDADGFHFYQAGSGTAGQQATFSESMRIDSSGNLLISKTSANNAIVGTQIMSTGDINPTVSGDTVARFNRLGTDGEIIRFQHDTSTDGAINSFS